MKFSKYIRVYNDILDKYCVLFNTRNKAIVAVENHYISDNQISDDISTEIKSELTKHGFFLSDIEEKELLKQLICDDRLIISVELSHCCNLSCSYCYQKDHKKNIVLSDEKTNELVAYCDRVLKQKKVRQIVLKILGGEPLLTPQKFDSLVNRIKRISEKSETELVIMIDTNGTIPLENPLKSYDGKVVLRVPLCERNYHNHVRNEKGKGTFDQIVDNLNKVILLNKNTEIILRHNTDHNNMNLYDKFIKQMKEKALFTIKIELAYTVNFDGNTFNKLSYEDYVEWKSDTAIKIAVDNDIPIMQAPMMNYSPCQFNSTHSIKMCADGTVLPCPASHIKLNIGEDVETNNTSVYDSTCLDCESFYLCGGVMKLPCVREVINNPNCLDKSLAENHAINVHAFIKSYIDAMQNGKQSLFVSFLGI